MSAAYRWSLKLHRRQPSDKLRESLGQGPAKSSTASTFSVWKCVLSTAMVEENSHDLELQKLLSTSKEGTCANAARLKEGQGSYKDTTDTTIWKPGFKPHFLAGGENYTLWTKAAIFISGLSIILTTGFGVTFLVASQISGSSAAFGFAFVAVLDSLSSGIVFWRFFGADTMEPNTVSLRERRACIAISVCFILSAIAITSRAVYALVADNKLGREELMKMLSLASLIFLIFLAGFKGLIASKVESRAMKTDAINSLAEAVMTLGMIASDEFCKRDQNICFLDSAVAITIAVALLAYGIIILLQVALHHDESGAIRHLDAGRSDQNTERTDHVE
ncbi:Transmembrane protein 163 [Acropora cervicornis]|uniref:Transmembrane protein 163 n=1 Tax=Acropora cervicornis TaxID=6130 RepID=A0AAD9QIK5_ACRCE|nr:Transmembrane protein 163 [Acropora cervicornis]